MNPLLKYNKINESRAVPNFLLLKHFGVKRVPKTEKCRVESGGAKHLLKQKISSFKKDLKKELQELGGVLSK